MKTIVMAPKIELADRQRKLAQAQQALDAEQLVTLAYRVKFKHNSTRYMRERTRELADDLNSLAQYSLRNKIVKTQATERQLYARLDPKEV